MTIDEAKEWLHKEVPTEILLERIYEEFKLELEAEYKRGWSDRHTQSDLEGRSCNNCRSKHCDIKRELLERSSINPGYFNCNDWEQK